MGPKAGVSDINLNSKEKESTMIQVNSDQSVNENKSDERGKFVESDGSLEVLNMTWKVMMIVLILAL
jgi:hypothetical protein